jgi:hypothetical protein
MTLSRLFTERLQRRIPKRSQRLGMARTGTRRIAQITDQE